MLATFCMFFEATTREIIWHALNQHDAKPKIICVDQDIPSPCRMSHFESSDILSPFTFKHCDALHSDENKIDVTGDRVRKYVEAVIVSVVECSFTRFLKKKRRE